MPMSPSADIQMMRAIVALETDPARAAELAGLVLAEHPGHTEAQLLLATACTKLNDPGKALGILKALSPMLPASAFLALEMGRALLAVGHVAEARAALVQAVQLDAGLADAWRALAALYFADGQTVMGDRAYASYMALIADPVELGDASVALAENRLATAQALFEARLKLVPTDTVALRYLADISSRQGNYPAAERQLRECLKEAPGDARARFELAQLLHTIHQHEAALVELERLLAADPTNTTYIHLKAQTLRVFGSNEAAIEVTRCALIDHPTSEMLWLLMGHTLRAQGDQQAAIDAYRKVLTLRPESGAAYWSLANLKMFRFGEAEIKQMGDLLASAQLRQADTVHIEFALGKAFEDQGKYATSFSHYERGNRTQRSTLVYDPDVMSSDVARDREFFTQDFFDQRQGWGIDRADPIFIVGLPRSGSTLLEQILSSHSQIEGTRELPDLAAAGYEIIVSPTTGAYPESLSALDSSVFAACAARYLERTNIHRPLGKPRFVDKNLFNFGHVGIIHLMFPNAAIIDARRHPLGGGFSCYKQLFAKGMGFSYDQADMGRFYADYVALMDHYDQVLPGRIHRVHYEHLVADPESEVRRLLAYCQLPFEAGCLQFYNTRRVVTTISSEQVRQPIYSESVDRWREYEAWLEPLRRALGPLVERYPHGS